MTNTSEGVTPEQKDWSTYRPNQWNFPLATKGETGTNGKRIVHVVSDRDVAVGDIIPSPVYVKYTHTVTKVLESRPAKGNWGDTNAVWFKVEVE